MNSRTICNLAELFRMRAGATPDRIAITYQRQSMTWLGLYQRAYQLHLRLAAGGVKRGDIVGILCPHCPAQVVALLAVAMTDGAFSIINPLLKTEGVKHQVKDAAMPAIVATRELAADLVPYLRSRHMLLEMVSTDGLSEEGEDQPATVDPDRGLAISIPADVANVIYTSGSTGRPKGVLVPHRTLLDGARIVSGYLRIGSDDVTLSILPLGFDYGLNQLLTATLQGARLVLHRHILPSELLAILEAERVTGMAAVPSLWPNLLAAGTRKARRRELGHLRYVTTAGGVHPPELLDQLDRFFPATEIIVMYGLTESFRSTYLPYPEMRRRPGSIGRAVPEVEIIVRNQLGQPCAAGEKGELIHRGAFVTYGYLNCPELTAERFIELPTGGPGGVPERAVRSGDLVSLDSDGYVYFHGRLDMLIKSAGYRISPDEVMAAMLSVPGVRQAAVLGMPDPVLGQSIVAATETADGRPISQAELKAQLLEKLPSYAIPRRFVFYQRLPLTANGKIDYAALSHDLCHPAPQLGSQTAARGSVDDCPEARCRQ